MLVKHPLANLIFRLSFFCSTCSFLNSGKRAHNKRMWEDPQELHKTPYLDRKTITKWLRKSSLNEFNVWHDTNAIIKRLCKDILRRMDEDRERSKKDK